MHEKFTIRSILKLEVLFLSFFGVGFSPKAPGTMGTLAALPLLYAASLLGAPKFFFIPFLVVTIVASCLVADMVEKTHELHDPQWIVIDEVLGVSVAWLFVPVDSLLSFISIFLLFRFFDIFKWGPVRYFDQLEHGAGTILDDIAAGIMAGLTYFSSYALLTHFSS
jgi:phosphatidylglycerophosphatase A